MTQIHSNKGGNGKNNNSNGGKPSYFEEAKALYERFRAEIAAAAEKKDEKYLNFTLGEIVGKFAEETDRRGKMVVRFYRGAMNDDQLEMLINASGLSFGEVINGAIATFPNVFGKNADVPERRCHVRTMIRAHALTVACIIADEEVARVTAEEKKFLAGLAGVLEKAHAPRFEPKMVRGANGELDVVPVAVEPADETGAKDGTTGA